MRTEGGRKSPLSWIALRVSLPAGDAGTAVLTLGLRGSTLELEPYWSRFNVPARRRLVQRRLGRFRSSIPSATEPSPEYSGATKL